MLVVISQCNAVSLSITTGNNNNGFEKVSEFVSVDTLGSFHGLDTIGQDFRYHEDSGQCSGNCAYSLEYWYMYMHGPIPLCNIAFTSYNRDTTWSDCMSNGQVAFTVESVGR
jgi:hypothetical protein